ncbi:MAG: PAS domain S-box protein [Chitinophagaceae bacterium]|nr:PAS domain S-box protein [Chitinophagaceae bacterium]
MQDEHSDISFYGDNGPDLSRFPAFDIIRNVDLQTHAITWSENYYTHLGYPRHKVPANDQSWINPIFPPDKQMVVDSLNLAIREKQDIWTAEYRFMKASGEVIEITDRCFIFYDDQLKPVRLMGTMQDISSFTEALRRVQEVEEQYRNLFERASDPIVIHDVAGKLYNVNQAAADFSGYSRAEMLQMKVADFLLLSDLMSAPEAVQELRAGKTSYRVRRIRLRTGLHKIAEVSSRMLPDGKIQAILRDITDKTESDLALVASESRFRTLAEHAPVGIFETNLDGDIIYVNEKITEYTGASRDELMGQSWIKYIHKEDRDFIPKEWKILKDLLRDSRKQIRFIHKSGAIFWTQTKTIPLLGKNGEPEGFMGTVTDITAEKLALESLRHSEEKFRTLVEQASDGIFIGDKYGRIVMANSAACNLTQFSEEELLQKTIHELTDPEELKKHPFQFAAMMEPGGARSERKLILKNGTLLNVELSGRFLPDNERYIAFVHDITNRKKREDEIRLSNERFRLIATATNDMVWDWDIANNKTWWNDNFYIQMGYDRLEVDGNLNTWYDGLHPDDRDKTWTGLKKHWRIKINTGQLNTGL